MRESTALVARSIALIACLPLLAAAQSEPQAIPRTAWGTPDLQGVYDFASAIPLERPAELGDRAQLTAEEAAAQSQRNAERYAEGVNTDNLSPPNYNNFWYDHAADVPPTRRSSLIVDPPDGRLPDLAPQQERKAAAERAAGGRPVRMISGGVSFDGPEDRGLAERCLIGFNAGPPVSPSAYNNYLQVFQTPDYVVILTEMVHDARIVPLDGRARLPRGIPQWLGDSRGRWEGDVLVIETENFRPDRGFFFGRHTVGPGERMRLTERLARLDAGTLLYEYTYDDAEVFAQPFSASIPLRRTSNAVFEYACHEGNYGLMNILRGARADDAGANP